MSAFLAPHIEIERSDASRRDEFFDSDERKKVRAYIEDRECQDQTFPPSCDLNLFLGFFFDGTNNNLKQHFPRSHSNVARLYLAFPGGKDQYGSEPWPGMKTKYHNCFFRTYLPGPGTPFPEIGDSGAGFTLRDDRPKGLAFCFKGENRIIWALVEAINNVHRYYTDAPLISESEFKERFNGLDLPGIGAITRHPYPHSEYDSFAPPSDMTLFDAAFSGALRRLHESLKSFLPARPGKSRDRGVVRNIYTSMFGFSRGAAEARAFCNWFIWLCRRDAALAGGTGLTLATVPVTIDFLGLFDTVASVGLAASTQIADGHQAWADTEASLRIPPEPKECLHLVSGHEVRRSFPLDSVLFRGSLPSNCREIVFPGVHSDVGGGYAPMEQGRGTDEQGSDLISRIPLSVMYRAARLAGVPLKLEEAPESAKLGFRIDPATIRAFNAYIGACAQECGGQPGVPVQKPLHELMRQQHRLYIQWRKTVLGRMAELPSVQACDAHDRADILNADKELAAEIRYFQSWRRNAFPGQLEHAPNNPEWADIDHYWDDPPPPPAVTDLFERYVHDSRAWFKPLGKDLPGLQHYMDLLVEQHERETAWDADHPYDGNDNPYRLSAPERKKLARYMQYKDGPDARAGLEPESTGREPMSFGGGLLRYRKIYMGSDSFKPSGALYAGIAPARHDAEDMLPQAAGGGEPAFA